MERIPARDLRLADVVQLSKGPFCTAIVTQVTEETPKTAGLVKFYRPYGTTADFSYTGGVVAYVGIEEFSVLRGDTLYDVMERKELL